MAITRVKITDCEIEITRISVLLVISSVNDESTSFEGRTVVRSVSVQTRYTQQRIYREGENETRALLDSAIIRLAGSEEESGGLRRR